MQLKKETKEHKFFICKRCKKEIMFDKPFSDKDAIDCSKDDLVFDEKVLQRRINRGKRKKGKKYGS